MAELRILTASDLYDLIVAGEQVQVLDVRTPQEFAGGHIAGSTLAPYDEVLDWPAQLSKEQPVAVICKAGARAMHAAAMLDQLTSGVIYVVADGGVPDWPDFGGTLDRD